MDKPLTGGRDRDRDRGWPAHRHFDGRRGVEKSPRRMGLLSRWCLRRGRDRDRVVLSGIPEG